MKLIRYTFTQFRQQPLLSIISVIGTAITICFIMVIVLMEQIKVMPFTPESNRDRFLQVKGVSITRKKWDGVNNSLISERQAHQLYGNLEGAEAMTVYLYSAKKNQINIEGSAPITVLARGTDASFWQVFDFHFIAGKPYSEAHFKAEKNEIILSESIAKKIFKGLNPIGKSVLMNFREYTVVGVVEDVTQMASSCFAQAWYAYASSQQTTFLDGLIGYMKCTILAETSASRAQVKEAASVRLRYFNQHNPGGYEIIPRGRPETQLESASHPWLNQNIDMDEIYLKWIIVLLILLIVPAINLNAMIQSRLSQRFSEIGLRRSFGATRGSIIKQITLENLILTFLSGLLGLIFCILVTVYMGDFFFQDSYNAFGVFGTSLKITWDMLVQPRIFLLTCFFCLVLNLLSSLLPAWRASRKPVVDLLK